MLLENKKSKEILIFYSGTNGIGGIETLLSRLMTFLQQSGYSATCIMRNATPIVSLLGGHRVLSLNENFSDLMDPGRLKRLLTQERLCSAAAVISLDSYSSIFAALTARILRSNKCIAVSTNWVPNYYSKTIIAGWRPLPLLLRWNMKSNFNSRTTLVMMEKYRQDGQRALGSNWNATIMPIPVPTHASTDFIHVPEPGKIVSIGRLDAMKSYNVYMIETMSKLRSMGFNINWHVYGTGVLQEEMDTLILERKASGYIKLHGDLPYSDITRILSSAHIFVGMGTSSIEAAVAGVPGPVAIAFDRKGLTHGSIHRCSLGNCGEVETDKELLSIEGELLRILTLSSEEYDQESALVRKHAQGHSEQAVLRTLMEAFEPNEPRNTCTLAFAVACLTYQRVRSLFR